MLSSTPPCGRTFACMVRALVASSSSSPGARCIKCRRLLATSQLRGGTWRRLDRTFTCPVGLLIGDPHLQVAPLSSPHQLSVLIRWVDLSHLLPRIFVPVHQLTMAATVSKEYAEGELDESTALFFLLTVIPPPLSDFRRWLLSDPLPDDARTRDFAEGSRFCHCTGARRSLI